MLGGLARGSAHRVRAVRLSPTHVRLIAEAPSQTARERESTVQQPAVYNVENTYHVSFPRERGETPEDLFRRSQRWQEERQLARRAEEDVRPDRLNCPGAGTISPFRPTAHARGWGICQRPLTQGSPRAISAGTGFPSCATSL